MSYNAFISYSHAGDTELAAALQRALHRFAKPAFRLRAVRVFCDSASLAANPALWPTIETALNGSEFLILLASPQAAASAWVKKEVDYWCHQKAAPKTLIALTAGEIAWDEAARDFDWTRTTALPGCMRRVFEAEPLWVDLRWARDSQSNSLAHPRFRDCVADLAAPLHARPKDELIGEDIRQARQIRRITTAVIVLLAALALALGWTSVVAERRRQLAARERDQALRSQSHFLADAALQQVRKGDPELGVLLALEALPRAEQERPYVAEAEAALHTALGSLVPRHGATLAERHDFVSSARFSPDGKRMVTVTSENVARVWDAATGAAVATLTGHQKPVWFADYLPDGSGIVTASADGTARLWNAGTGRQVRIFEGHGGPVLYAAISADGRLLATASSDRTARIWEIGDGSVRVTLRGHKQELCCVQLSPLGLRAVTASVDGTARLWDTQSGKTLGMFKGMPEAFAVPAGTAAVIRFNPDGRVVATAHEDHVVRLWDAVDGSQTAELKGFSAEITDAAFSSDGGLLAAASEDGTARIWRLKGWRDGALRVSDGPVLQPKHREGRLSKVKAVAFTRDNNFVVTAGEDYLRIWDAASGEEAAAQELDATAGAIVVSRDGASFATLHTTGVQVWDVPGSVLTQWRLRVERDQIEPADRGPVITLSAAIPGFTWEDERGWEPPVAITGDASTAAAVTGRGFILIDGETGRVMARIAGHSRVISRAAFNTAGNRLLTTSYDGTAKIWDARSGAMLGTLAGHTKPVWDGAFSPADDLIATASEDGTARLWTTKGEAKLVLTGHQAGVRRVAFSGDGTRVITVSDDQTARVWEIASGREIARLSGAFGTAALDAAGERAATAGIGKDFTSRLWDPAEGKQLRQWNDAQGTITGLAFSNGGKQLLSWGVDGFARVRIAAETSGGFSDVGTGCPGTGSVVQAYISKDGSRILTVLRNGRVDAWDSHSGAGLLTLYTFPATRSEDGCGELADNAPEVISAAAADVGRVLVAGDNGDLVLFAVPSRAEAMRSASQLVRRALTPEERRQFFLQK
jgi:WD40 repeat protein